MSVMMVAVTAGLIAAVVVLARSHIFAQEHWVSTNPHNFGHCEDAIEIARRRYAAGEIDQDQFERLRRDLGG